MTGDTVQNPHGEVVLQQLIMIQKTKIIMDEDEDYSDPSPADQTAWSVPAPVLPNTSAHSNQSKPKHVPSFIKNQMKKQVSPQDDQSGLYSSFNSSQSKPFHSDLSQVNQPTANTKQYQVPSQNPYMFGSECEMRTPPPVFNSFKKPQPQPNPMPRPQCPSSSESCFGAEQATKAKKQLQLSNSGASGGSINNQSKSSFLKDTLLDLDLKSIPPPPSFTRTLAKNARDTPQQIVSGSPNSVQKNGSQSSSWKPIVQNQTNIPISTRNPALSSRIRVVEETKPAPAVGQNVNWVINLDSNELEWGNSKRAPQEVKIMLGELERQASPLPSRDGVLEDNVSDPVPFTTRFEYYQYNPQVLKQIKEMAKEFSLYRKVKGDGNCFYRAFNFAFLEMALTHTSSLYFLRLLFCMSDPSKVRFQTNRAGSRVQGGQGFSPAALRSHVLYKLLILYSYRVTLAESNDLHWHSKIVCSLQDMFNEAGSSLDTFLIMGIKSYIVSVLGNMEQSKLIQNWAEVKEEILRFGQQCSMNELPIKALSESLCICVSLYQEIDGQCRFANYGAPKYEKVVLYFRKGHYDLIYPHKSLSG